MSATKPPRIARSISPSSQLRVDGVLLVKRLVREGAGFAVRSDIPAAVPVDLAGGVDVIGRVLWAGRRL